MKAITKAQFRAALLLSYVTGLVGVGLSIFGEAWLPAPLREYLEQQLDAEPTLLGWLVIALGLPLLGAALVSAIALFKFWRWARELSIAVTIIAIIVTPVFGPNVELGITSALYCLSNILYGAVLALAYFSPAAEWFVSGKPAEPPPYPVGGAAMGGMSE